MRLRIISIHVVTTLLMIAAVALALAAAQDADRRPISLELLVPADARVEFDGTITTETGGRRTFETPPLAVGKEYTYTLTVTARGKTVKRDVTVSHKGKNSFDLRPDFAPARRGNPEAEAAIQKQAEAFVDAFHKGDAQAVAACWTPDGEYTDETGRKLTGREAIEKAFTEFFAKYKGLKVGITSESLEFVTPDVAIEEGVSEVFPADGGPPSRARFRNVHAKKDGRWLLSNVKESAYTPPSNYEHLRPLEWAIGEWASDNTQGPVEHISLSWTETRNFIIGSFSTSVKDLSVGSAKEWIGWDPRAQRIRSWSFDDTGAFGEGAWTRDGDRWVIKSSIVLQDGKKATATYIIGPVDADTITLAARDRTVEGNALPEVKEVKLKRVK
jgi:uncharacterized protein (TIGR02246 family)